MNQTHFLLYTASNAIIKAINIQSLEGVNDTPNNWNVTSFTIDSIPIVAYFTPQTERWKGAQYRFLWDGIWFRISSSDGEKASLLGSMIFYTKPLEVVVIHSPIYNPHYQAGEAKEESHTQGPFITIIQAPNTTGLFVGTILRAFTPPGVDGKINCIFKDQEITLESDYYRLAEPSEIMSYFYLHSNGAIWVQLGSPVSAFLATIKCVKGTEVVYHTYKGIKAVAVSPDYSVHINYVFLPTREQILDHKVQEAKNDGFEVGTLVTAPIIGEVVIQSFSIDMTNKLIATVGKPGNSNAETTVPIKSLSILREAWNVTDGVALATQVLASIPDMNSSFISAKVKEDFLETLRSWCDNRLKTL